MELSCLNILMKPAKVIHFLLQEGNIKKTLYKKAVKGYDLESVTKEIEKIIDENSIILPLLNGADIYDRMRQHLKKGYILPACLYIGTHLEAPGIIFQNGGSCQISVGKDPLYQEFYPENLMSLFKQANILIEFFEDVDIEIWSKYIFIASFALVTATYNKTIGEVANDAKLGILVKNIMQEIKLVANALKLPSQKPISFRLKQKHLFKEMLKPKVDKANGIYLVARLYVMLKNLIFQLIIQKEPLITDIPRLLIVIGPIAFRGIFFLC
jgi:hypothetical protein